VKPGKYGAWVMLGLTARNSLGGLGGGEFVATLQPAFCGCPWKSMAVRRANTKVI